MEERLAPSTGAAQTWFSALPVAWHNSTWIAERTIDYLARNGSGKPFCTWTSFPDPHHPFDCPEPWSRMYDPKSWFCRSTVTRDLERRPWWHKAVLEGKPQLADPVLYKFRAEGSRVPDQSDAQLAEMTANYYGMISLIDHNVGRILDALDEYRPREGHAGGLHDRSRRAARQSRPLPEAPDSLRGSAAHRHGRARAGRRRRVAWSASPSRRSISRRPSTTIRGGAARALQSRSLRPLLEGKDATRDVAYSEWHVHASRCGVALKLRTVRTKTHKCTFELDSGAGELYDLVNDPEEMTNRFEDPSYAKVRSELYDMMRSRPGEVLQSLAEPVGMA